MIQAHESAILDLALISLQGAIRRIAARLLEGSWELDVRKIRRVEDLMRIALDLAGAGNGMPIVDSHDLPPAGPGGAAGDSLGQAN